LQAHEVLAVVCGEGTLRLGGERAGQVLTVVAGDVILIPAGVAHQSVELSSNFLIVRALLYSRHLVMRPLIYFTPLSLVQIGAYPEGQDRDFMFCRAEDRPKVDDNISAVRLPARDPVYGDLESAPINRAWKGRKTASSFYRQDGVIQHAGASISSPLSGRLDAF